MTAKEASSPYSRAASTKPGLALLAFWVRALPQAGRAGRRAGGGAAARPGGLSETRPRPVGVLVQGAPEGEHVDALVGELELVPLDVRGGKVLGRRGYGGRARRQPVGAR